MTVQEIINLALSNTHTKSSQISDANKILFFNLARHSLARTIISDVNENFFFEIWMLDAEDDTHPVRVNGEYLYPQVTSSTNGMSKLLKLAVKTTSEDEYHIPAREVDLRSLKFDWLWYLKNQPKSEPIYHISDQSFFIAPAFRPEDLPDDPSDNKQLKCTGIITFADLAADALENAVLIPKDYHETIALGMEKYIYKARKKKDEAMASINELTFAKQDMIDKLTNRDDSYMTAKLPDDTATQYAD